MLDGVLQFNIEALYSRLLSEKLYVWEYVSSVFMLSVSPIFLGVWNIVHFAAKRPLLGPTVRVSAGDRYVLDGRRI